MQYSQAGVTLLSMLQTALVCAGGSANDSNGSCGHVRHVHRQLDATGTLGMLSVQTGLL